MDDFSPKFSLYLNYDIKGVLSTPILIFCEIGIAISVFCGGVNSTILERLVRGNKPMVVVDEITIFIKSPGVSKILFVKVVFPPHPHIEDDVLSSDVKLESVPSIPQSFARVTSIGSLLPIPIPKLFSVLKLAVGEQTANHSFNHQTKVLHKYYFLSFLYLNYITIKSKVNTYFPQI